jgi:hypothetical protein
MAPEQIEKPQTVDHRADIYSLGVVFYEMLTGELPLGKFQSPSRMVQVDVRLDEVVLHALEKNPDRRYQHASEVKKDVETISRSTAPPQIKSVDQDMARLRGWFWAKAAFFCFAAVCALINAVWQADVTSSLWILAACGFGLLGYREAHAARTLVSGGVVMSKSKRVAIATIGGVGAVAAAVGFVGEVLTDRMHTKSLPLILPTAAVAIDSSRVVRVEAKLRQEIEKRMEEGGWRLEGLSVSVTPDFKQAECSFAKALEKGAYWTVGFSGGIRIKAQGDNLWLVTGENEFRWLRFSVDTSAEVVTAETSPAFDAVRALALFNDIEDFGHEFDAAFTSRNLAAAQTGTGRLLNLLSNFNEVVRGMDLGFPPAILDDVAKIRSALDEGDWEKARQLGQRNEEYARAFKRIGAQMVQLARQNPNALDALSPAPPVVVATVPESGAANVDPALTEIRITFSKPTRDYKLDWSKWRDAKFPDNIGPIGFVNDKRTCIIPVRLQAGEVYAIWITSQADRASLSGEDVAVSYLLIFETRKPE